LAGDAAGPGSGMAAFYNHRTAGRADHLFDLLRRGGRTAASPAFHLGTFHHRPEPVRLTGDDRAGVVDLASVPGFLMLADVASFVSPGPTHNRMDMQQKRAQE